MLELDIVGRAPLAEAEIERLAAIAAASAGVSDGHLAIEFVDAAATAPPPIRSARVSWATW